MALVTLAEVKAYLNVLNNSQDPWLTALIPGAESLIKQYCQRDFEEQEYTEYLQGTGRKQLILRHRPVTEVDSLYLDHSGNFGQTDDAFTDPETLLEEGEDYALDLDGTLGATACSYSGVVYRINTVWPELGRVYVPGRLAFELGPNFGNVKVTYTAGYPAALVPADLKMCVAMMVAYVKKTILFGGVPLKSEEMGKYAYELYRPYYAQFASLPELGTMRQILARYREVAWT